MVLGDRLDGRAEGGAHRDDEPVALVREEPQQLFAIAAAVVGLELLHRDVQLVLGPGEGQQRRVVEALVAQAPDVVDDPDLLGPGPGGPRRAVVATTAGAREERHREERDQRSRATAQHRANRTRAPRRARPGLAKVPTDHQRPLEARVKKRNLRLLSGLLALGLLAAACGDDDSTDADDTTTTAPDDTGPASEVGRARSPSTTSARRPRTPASRLPTDFTVRLVTDIGKVDDRTFNQYAYEGMQAAEECFGFETSFIETVSARPTTRRTSPPSLEGGPDVVDHRRLPARRPPPLAAANANPDTELHRHRPVPRPSTPTTTSACSSTRTRAATWPACWPPRSARAASSASSAAARTSRRWSSWSTATRPAPSR